MAKLIIIPGPHNKMRVEVDGVSGPSCVQIAQAFASLMGATDMGEPDLLPEYYETDSGQDLQQETQ